ncbi:hypothetical protein SAMN02745121_03512 [Nannocystis exedens]|uniref:Uncharacterized protein n=1 Tax=Nannocystis exedens TaxID=54 RepID=A0A1I1YWF7_9BACT|nr:hypothetical protein [Nannocystis exedens]PCC70167.1 hypothetical protein NAEX_03200 [Nannocystis exedens]SFE22493.1 hypothetical protein SAMN02745121_03512 [Nannocystis exedens]
MNHATKVLFVLALAVGCDQQEILKKEIAVVTAAKERQHTAPVEVAPKTAAAVGSASGVGTFASLSDCLTSCDDIQAPTDRKTCRLNCDTAYGAEARGTAEATENDAIARITSCLGRCNSSQDSESCANSCQSMAAQADFSPPTEVLTKLASCVKLCHTDKGVRATDQATCELNCAQVARVESTPPPQAALAAPAS